MTGAGGITITTAVHHLSAGGTPPVDTPRGPAREAARDELTDPRYHEHDPNLLERGLDHLWKWIGDLLDSAAGSGPGGKVGLVVLTLVVIGLSAALWWRLGTPQRVVRTRRGLLVGSARTAADHRAAAAAHASAHRWTEACQERMRAIVRALEDRAVLDPQPGRTADEAAVEAGSLMPAHADRLLSCAHLFDDITYGGRAADEHAYLALCALETDLESARPLLTVGTVGEEPR
ncbi:DUF4129 domain-containing protein [Streptomyces sp. NPDC059166]|uniref:DUF4129 domain-containing protein n=1 Tax=Streptomyces sp. NPDC059166 TaxID=3346752 RepID=UPI00367C8638